MTVVAVVQARMGSSRFPGKVLADLGGVPMLRYMLDRLARASVDGVVVATSTDRRDEPVVDVAEAAGIAVVRGSEHDVLGRFRSVLDRHPANTVVRLTADCPLTDPAIVDAVVAAHAASGADYTSNTLLRTFPVGLDVEVMSAAALLAAADEATDPPEREHVTPFLYRRPERFRLAAVLGPMSLGEERWTVDTRADLAVVRTAADRLDRLHHWEEVLAVLPPPDRNPALRPARESDVLPDGWQAGDPTARVWVVTVDGHPSASVRLTVRTGLGVVDLVVTNPRAAGIGLPLLLHALRADYQVTRIEAGPGAAGEAAGAGFTKEEDTFSWSPRRP